MEMGDASVEACVSTGECAVGGEGGAAAGYHECAAELAAGGGDVLPGAADDVSGVEG